MPARGYSTGGGSAKQVNLGGSPNDVYAVATRAIESNGGQILWQQPPQAAKFLLMRKSAWSTLGFTIRYDGDLVVQQPGPGQNSARYSLKVQWGSTVGLFVSMILFVVVMAMFNYYFAAFSLILIIAYVALTAWTLSSQVPEKALDELVRSAQSGGGPVTPQAAQPQWRPQQPQPHQGFAPQPQPQTQTQTFTPAPPQPAPAPTPAPAPAPAPAGGGDTAAIVEQIKQLAGLRDAGAISPEEFEAKKAELLARI